MALARLARLSKVRVRRRGDRQGVWATVLALSGKFDDLTNAVIFASWLFYALNAGSVLLLRRREPDRERPFRVPGYPIVPLVFVGLTSLLLVNTVAEFPLTSLFGLGMMALGAAVFFVFVESRPKPEQ
jgi:APA family basic amino acid/polyamine antiporter